jgi:hypothetical protein
VRREASALLAAGCVEEGVEGVHELLFDPGRFGMGGAADGMPLWVDGFEVFREDGKEDNEGRRLEVVIEPLVEGR